MVVRNTSGGVSAAMRVSTGEENLAYANSSGSSCRSSVTI